MMRETMLARLIRALFVPIAMYAEAPGGGGTPPAGAPPAGAPPAGTPPAGAPPAGTPPAGATPPGGTPPAEPSLLSQGKEGAKAEDHVPLPGEDDDPAKFIPEKYRVMKKEGDAEVFDPIASAKKLAEAHGELEKRAGTLGLAPEKPADYKVQLPENSPIPAEAIEGPAMDKFRADAHAAGMTQKQFDAAVSAHLVSLGNFAQAIAEQGATLAKTELEQDPEWKGDNLPKQMKLAYRTFAAFATPEEAKEIDRIGNNPIFLKILARAGAMLGEDRLRTGTGSAAIVDDSTIEQYMAEGSPYWDPSHKDHKRVKDLVTRHHQAKYGNKPMPASTAG